MTETVSARRATSGHRTRRRPRDQPGHWFERDPLWFKRAVFYEIHIRGFFDGNGDGYGRLPGPDREARLPAVARRRLHLAAADLPVAAARRRLRHRRLLPHPPRLRDDRGLPPFVDAAHERGMRVIADLVMNHTSDRAPVVPGARARGPGSPERDWYVWSDTIRPLRGRADHLHRHRAVELDVGPGGRRLLLAPLLLPPARPQLREPRRCRRR